MSMLRFVIKVCAISCFLLIQGSARGTLSRLPLSSSDSETSADLNSLYYLIDELQDRSITSLIAPTAAARTGLGLHDMRGHHAVPPQGCSECLSPKWPKVSESHCLCVLPLVVKLMLTDIADTIYTYKSDLVRSIAIVLNKTESQVNIRLVTPAGNNGEDILFRLFLMPLGEKFDDSIKDSIRERFGSNNTVYSHELSGNVHLIDLNYPEVVHLPSTTSPSLVDPAIPLSGPSAGFENRLHPDLDKSFLVTTIILSVGVIFLLFWLASFMIMSHGSTSPTQMTKGSNPSGNIRRSSCSSSCTEQPLYKLGYGGAECTAKQFSYDEVNKATNGFHKIIGEGSFGCVYSGVLDDGTQVAIKVLKKEDHQVNQEFWAEVRILSRLDHVNIVKLIGTCHENQCCCLVYNHIPNGSLESHLYGAKKGNKPLDWSARLKIALGSAQALAYLHEKSQPRIIHRDFNTSNILLEDDFTPKVCDFGLARTVLHEEAKHVSTRVMGTFGYVAPEYAMTGHLLTKSDVYSYGVVLLELLTGRKPVDMSRSPGQENLVAWARPLLRQRHGLEMIMDTSLGPIFPFDCIEKVADVASACVQPEVSHRPSMMEVVQSLKPIYERMIEVLSSNSSQEECWIGIEDASSSISDYPEPNHRLSAI